MDDLPGHDQRNDGRLRQGHRQDPGLTGDGQYDRRTTGSTTRTSSRARRSRTRSRPSRSGTLGRSTAGRTRPPRPAPSRRSRTTSPTCGAGTRSRPAPSSSTPGRTTSTRSTSRPTCPATRTTRTAASSSTTGGPAAPGRHRQRGPGTVHQLRRDRQALVHRLAGLAVDAFIQDSWKVRTTSPSRAGCAAPSGRPGTPTGTTWPSSIPRYYDPRSAAVVDPNGATSSAATRSTASSCPATASPRRPGNIGIAAQRRSTTAFSAACPRASTRPTRAPSSRGSGWRSRSTTRRWSAAGAGIFHQRVVLNDTRLLGGNAPIQFKVGVTNGQVDQPTGATSQDVPARDDHAGQGVQAPHGLQLEPRVQRELPWSIVADVTYVGRMGLHLQRERNINQLQPGTIQANPGVNVNALRPYLGFGLSASPRTPGGRSTTACR